MNEDKDFRINCIAIVTCNAGANFGFQFINFLLPNLVGNIYLTSFLCGFFEIMAFSTSSICIRVFGMRRTIFIGFLFSFISLIVYYHMMNNFVVGAVFLGMVMFGIAANQNSTYLAAY